MERRGKKGRWRIAWGSRDHQMTKTYPHLLGLGVTDGDWAAHSFPYGRDGDI